MRKTIVRMEESLYQKVKAAAKAQSRSVNTFINGVLDHIFRSFASIPTFTVEEYYREVFGD